jgi:hypothetical protein
MTAERPRYKKALRLLQIELVKLQRHLIKNDLKILVLIEGRDAAGKDGLIERIVQHLSPRETRVVALGVPSDRDRSSWYFQRYVPHLPAAQEMVLMNRSVDCPDKDEHAATPDRAIVFPFEAKHLRGGAIAPWSGRRPGGTSSAS